MGIQRTITFSVQEPDWSSVVTALQKRGEQPVLRMIDNLPAFPDEIPAENWQELRVSVTGGMVTIRRAGRHWSCVVWGNADDQLRKGWDACCQAIAEAGAGTLEPEVT